MITRYFFDANTTELLWEIQWPVPGVSTSVRHRSLPPIGGFEVTMVVKEGADAEREMIEWRRSLKPHHRVLNTSMPSWLFWLK